MLRGTVKAFIVVICLFVFAGHCLANTNTSIIDPLGLYLTTWGTVGQKYDLDPYLLYAIALNESGKIDKTDGLVYPTPYIISGGIFGGVFTSKGDVFSHYTDKIGDYKHINIGCMQINLFWNKKRIKNIEDVFSFEGNLDLGAQILKDAIRSAKTLELGIGRYKTWKTKEAIEYGQHILSIVERLRRLPV